MSDRPGVSSHLQIPVHEYDARIRTFVPFYEEMLDVLELLVASVADQHPMILDLGIGTGALAERCLNQRPQAELIGIDADPEMLRMARLRLQGWGGIDLLCGSYLDIAFPRSDLIVASISLHHVPDPDSKKQLYGRCRQALENSGIMLLADCYLPLREDRAAEGMIAWQRHLEQHYTPEEAVQYLQAWSEEDTYFPLAEEIKWLARAGFEPDVVWRKDLFAVLLCIPRSPEWR
jgi:tRNA (cmo5U34)-methyltransferase